MVRFVPGKISTRKAHWYALHFQFNWAQLKLDSDAIQTKLYLYMQSFFLWKLLLWIFFTISASNILYNRPPQTSVLLHCGNSPREKLVFLRKSLSQRRRTMVCGEVSLKKFISWCLVLAYTLFISEPVTRFGWNWAVLNFLAISASNCS